MSGDPSEKETERDEVIEALTDLFILRGITG